MSKQVKMAAAWLILSLLITALANAEVITTSDGKVYKEVTMNRADPDGIVVSYKPDGGGSGIAKIKFANLSESLRQKYGYDAKKAAEFEKSQASFQTALQAKLWEDFKEATNRSNKLRAEEERNESARAQSQRQAEIAKASNLGLASIESLQAKAAAGDTSARRELAERDYRRWRETRTPEDRDRAINTLRPFADTDDNVCKIHLGYALMDGTWYNFEEGMHYLCAAADRGNTEAMNALGVIYARGGAGMPANKGEAMRWYRAAAERGVISTALGQLYESDGNYVEALKWYEISRRRDHSSTATAMGGALQNKMSGDQIADAKRQADEFKPVQ